MIKRLNILLVESLAPVARRLEKLLFDMGHEVTSVTQALLAVEAIKDPASRFDLIVIDSRPGYIDEKAVILAVKTNNIPAKIILIAEAKQEEGVGGVDLILTKPTLNDLKEAVGKQSH